jgi:hypothetical protein
MISKLIKPMRIEQKPKGFQKGHFYYYDWEKQTFIGKKVKTDLINLTNS